MIEKKKAFFMLEVIISVAILALVIMSLFNVKDNGSLFISKINSKNIENSLFSTFLPFMKEEKSNSFLDLFEIQDKKLKKRFELFTVKKKEVYLDSEKIELKSNLNINMKKISIEYNSSTKSFYTFLLN